MMGIDNDHVGQGVIDLDEFECLRGL